jgi:transposase
MEGSNPLWAATAPEAVPPIVAEGETPFSRQHVWLTKQEHIELKSQIAFWKAQHERALKREKALGKELEKAKGEIRDLRQRLYGRKSEKAAQRDDRTFVGGGSSRPRGQQKGANGHGRTARPQLPVDEEVQDLPSGAPCCAICHQPYLPFFRTEDSDVVEVQVRAHIRRIKRKMYRRGCHCEVAAGLITAPLPPRLLPRNPLGISVWAEVLLDKYLYARPTHRLLQHYASLGLAISQGTITDGLKRVAPLFEPLIAAMHEKQMSESLFFGDETRWMVFETVEGKSGRRWYLWVTLSESVRYYRVAATRATAVPREHFATLDEDIACAILVCDRYSAYKCLAKEMPVLLLAFCWAHVRRDFIDAARRFPQHKEWMFDWVEAIRELYRINKQRLGEWDPEAPLEQQSAAFARHHQALIAALSAMEQRRDEALRQAELPDPQRAVLTSLKTHWAGLTVFVTHPETPMDNNTGERGVRKGVLGRNAYHGSGSQWSAHLMAAMLTMLQTLVHWEINAHHWMNAFLLACAEQGGRCPQDLTAFLPWTMSETRKRALSQPLTQPPSRSSTCGDPPTPPDTS